MKLRDKIYIVNWILYAILIVVAVFVIIESGVIQKFLKKNTDTYETEIETNVFLPPEFTICDWSYRILGLNNQYYIDYSITNDLFLEAWKKVNNFERQVLYDGACFLITPPSNLNLTYNLQHIITVNFNSSLNIGNLPRISASVSSKNNPELFGIRYDGNFMFSTICAQEIAIFKMKEERTEYLPYNCRPHMILEYLANTFLETKINCSLKCWPKESHLNKEFDKRLNIFSNCKSKETSKCVLDWFRTTLKNAKTFCNMVSYIGDVDTLEIGDNDSWCSQKVFEKNMISKLQFIQYLTS